MALPNFLVIGALKCGTTSLHSYLVQHPEIYMSPRKELRFFCYDDNVAECRNKPMSVFPIRTIEDYEAQFEGASNEKMIGEVSPQYLMSYTTAARIKQYIPDVKLIASLRNPVDRAYSGYIMNNRLEKSRPPFVDEFRDPDRLAFCLYYDHVKRYFDTFDKNQIKVILQEDLKADTQGVMEDLFRFLEVDDRFVPDMSERKNLGGIPKSGILHRVLGDRLTPRTKNAFKPFVPQWALKFRQTIKKKNMEKAPPLSSELRAELLEFCREDINKLQDLLGRDLSIWFDRPLNSRA